MRVASNNVIWPLLGIIHDFFLSSCEKWFQVFLLQNETWFLRNILEFYFSSLVALTKASGENFGHDMFVNLGICQPGGAFRLPQIPNGTTYFAPSHKETLSEASLLSTNWPTSSVIPQDSLSNYSMNFFKNSIWCHK